MADRDEVEQLAKWLDLPGRGLVSYEAAATLRALSAELEQVKVSRWQPIETAPRDGTWFLAWYPPEDGDPGFCDTARWVPVPRELNADSWTIGGLDPTHWMPFPEPPVIAGETDG